MKRSEINHVLREAEAFVRDRRVALPPLASWSPADWQSKGSECAAVVARGLGWDVTDFGGGDFARKGLLLLTLRNGPPPGQGGADAKDYAEKLLIVRDGQLTPTHFHWAKMEDIINRGGGELVLRLWNSDGDRGRAETPVRVECDGVARTVAAGEELALSPGESVTLPPRLWHAFWSRGGTTLVGEVSRVNDDANDNNFLEPAGRFPEIDEDEQPLHLLVGDYARFYCP